MSVTQLEAAGQQKAMQHGLRHDPTHLDLFSGIGGFALAAQWAGFRTIGFCEIDPYCQKVLAKNFLADTEHTKGSRFGRDGGKILPDQESVRSGCCRIYGDIFALNGRDFCRSHPHHRRISLPAFQLRREATRQG